MFGLVLLRTSFFFYSFFFFFLLFFWGGGGGSRWGRIKERWFYPVLTYGFILVKTQPNKKTISLLKYFLDIFLPTWTTNSTYFLPRMQSPCIMQQKGLAPSQVSHIIYGTLQWKLDIKRSDITNCFLRSQWINLFCFILFMDYWYNKISDITNKISLSQGCRYTEFPLYRWKGSSRDKNWELNH